MDGVPLEWVRAALRDSPSAMSLLPWIDDDNIWAIDGGAGLQDPGKDPRFRKLVEAVRYQRRLLLSYNAVLVGLLLLFAIWHWGERIAMSQRRRAMAISAAKEDFEPKGTEQGEPEVVDGSSSSSSSTLEGTSTPPDAGKTVINDEREPLLPGQRKTSRRSEKRPTLFQHYVQAWLMYQPRPIPKINKTLPPNGVSLVVLAFLGLNVFYAFFRMPMSLQYLFVFADRCGLIFVSNLPLLYLFAAKNQPIKWLTGYSYEALNIFHRRVGELMCFAALLHFGGMLGVWYGMLRHIGFSLARFLFSRLSLLGLLAFVAYQLIYLTSLGSFRQRFYELFLALHVVLQSAALILLFFHYPTSQPYVLAASFIFLIDRLVFRLGLKTHTTRATLSILEDGETVSVSANWDIPPSSHFLHPTQQTIEFGWGPTDHVFLSIPSLSRTDFIQTHPFTIFSAAPSPSASSDTPTHAWLHLLIRAQSGFSLTLLKYARTNPITTIRLDGPYGSSHALETLRSTPNTVVVAGGSGIAVAFPLLWTLLAPASSSSDPESTALVAKRRRVHLLWVVHAREHLSWLPVERLKELKSWGLHVVITAPTMEAGRPDVKGYLRQWVAKTDNGSGSGVVVSGPDGMIRDVRNVCAGLVGEGRDVKVVVEKFGW
ncbi:uncharacterized protein BDZ99DRAFT_452788 [Mytilinidion resinicola]|uniref:FAD-binding FR-type domain-containing protein n=1 Tax=Mytilinidion resinicola TaxID=574789 RepID=A0A6A6Y5C8_9PEZI|nr:uncharacterized protein BDZ99DRAFT_452788 [Mytilinidion resinicola]KAF2803728.1 hypothetical protein BDZ99DRAFT_452788 [Mytilinidion resinicola]